MDKSPVHHMVHTSFTPSLESLVDINVSFWTVGGNRSTQIATFHQLPPWYILGFEGDPSKYKVLRHAFIKRTNVHLKGTVYYLKRYTRGRSWNLVQSCLKTSQERGTDTAIAPLQAPLQDDFGNSKCFFATRICIILTWMQQCNVWFSGHKKMLFDFGSIACDNCEEEKHKPNSNDDVNFWNLEHLWYSFWGYSLYGKSNS